MKKLALLAGVFSLLVSTGVQAQEGFGIDFHVNSGSYFIMYQNHFIQPDPNAESYEMLPEMDYKPTIGFSAGLGLSYGFSNTSALQLEFNITSGGQMYEDVVLGQATEREVSLSYIQVPILYRHYLLNGKLYLEGGPQIGLLQSASITSTYGDGNVGTFDDATEFYNSLDLGLLVGIGGRAPLGSNGLAVTYGLRLMGSLSDLNAEDYRFEDWGGVYEKSWNFMPGVHIGLQYGFGGGAADEGSDTSSRVRF